MSSILYISTRPNLKEKYKKVIGINDLVAMKLQIYMSLIYTKMRLLLLHIFDFTHNVLSLDIINNLNKYN